MSIIFDLSLPFLDTSIKYNKKIGITISKYIKNNLQRFENKRFVVSLTENIFNSEQFIDNENDAHDWLLKNDLNIDSCKKIINDYNREGSYFLEVDYTSYKDISHNIALAVGDNILTHELKIHDFIYRDLSKSDYIIYDYLTSDIIKYLIIQLNTNISNA